MIFAALVAVSAGAVATGASAQSSAASHIRIATFFTQLHAAPDNYARLRYARHRRETNDRQLRMVVDQIYASELATFGRPGDAAAMFPMDNARAPQTPLPLPKEYEAVAAAAFVVQAAEGRRVVMINEAHHRPQTRLLTLALLPRLRALGFTHFAVEGLDPADTALTTRGYPVEASGFYVGEPLYGEIVREALRLGFVVVAYEPPDSGRMPLQDRETRQAQALQAVLAAAPEARMFVHAGYAHVDKAPGQLAHVRPMAAELVRLTGIVPLSIDQTTLGHGNTNAPGSVWRQLLAAFPMRSPSVLVSRETGLAWSFRPEYHDITVLLPDPATPDTRPAWLSRSGLRLPIPIDTSACRSRFPCVVEARHAAEGDDAVPADQFVLLAAQEECVLFLRPGAYRLRIRGASGNVLSSRRLDVAGDGGLQAGAFRVKMAVPPRQRILDA